MCIYIHMYVFTYRHRPCHGTHEAGPPAAPAALPIIAYRNRSSRPGRPPRARRGTAARVEHKLSATNWAGYF